MGHLGRAMFYGSYFYNTNTWFSGILLLFILMAIAFMGYVLPWGQMSFWGATVITNLFSPFIFLKDFFGFILILCLYFLQTHFGVSCLSHPDNALEACALLTPLHIVPEWYFLCQYAMLKAVPNKNAGFIILLTSVFILFFFG